jgi:predicted Zn-dependent protease
MRSSRRWFGGDIEMKDAMLAVSFIVCLSLIQGCGGDSDYVPMDKSKLHGTGKVYFVPLGEFPAVEVHELVAYYKDKYGLTIEVTPRTPLDPSVINPERKQLVAEWVIDLMKQTYPALAGNPDAIMIGLTDEDMYISQTTWRFAFSRRQEGRYAVVSSARMGQGGPLVSAKKINSRLRKMVTKNIGLLYYNLSLSDNPQSVLYGRVMGLRDLDRMGEDF